MSADLCPTCGQPIPDGAPKPRPKRVQPFYRVYSVKTTADLAAAVTDFRTKNGGRDPLSIALAADLEHLESVGDVPVLVDPVLAKPAGYAYLEVGP